MWSELSVPNIAESELNLTDGIKRSKTKYSLANRIFMSSLFDQGLFDNQGGLGLGHVSKAIMFTPLPGFRQVTWTDKP